MSKMLQPGFKVLPWYEIYDEKMALQ